MTTITRGSDPLSELLNGPSDEVVATGPDYLRAAQILAERGWAKGVYSADDADAACAGIALTAAIGERIGVNNRFHVDGRTVGSQMGLDAPVQEWNDAPERDRDEVIEALAATGRRLIAVQN